jgi:hypothetical protein
LLDEAVKLACHSKRVQDINFNVSIHTDYDPEVGLVDIISNTLIWTLDKIEAKKERD